MMTISVKRRLIDIKLAGVHLERSKMTGDSEECLIPLRNRYTCIIGYAKVSSEDFDQLSKKKWHLSRQDNKTSFRQYAVCKDSSMHQAIMGIAPAGMVIDHINRNGLDNTRMNLRFATPSQNSQNITKRDGLSSRYLGVTKSRAKWSAMSCQTRLGTFETEIEAAKAYDRYVLQKFGKFASTNGFMTFEELEVNPFGMMTLTEKTEKKKCIQKRGDKFFIRLESEKVYHHLGPFTSEKEALLAFSEKKVSLEIQKHDRMMSLPILRNTHGTAVIVLHDRAGAVTGEAMVDDENWHQLNLIGWSLTPYGYAAGMISSKTCTMHRYLLDATGAEIDHINQNKLDNRLSNLRVTDHSNNCQNKNKKQTFFHTSFIGVSKLVSGRWTSRIRKGDRKVYIGSFDTDIEAAMMYNLYALQLYDRPLVNKIDNVAPSCVIVANQMLETFRAERNRIKADSHKASVIINNDEPIGLAAMKIVDCYTDKKFRGVCQSSANRWAAEIRKDGTRYRLGVHTSPEAAAYAYDQKAKELFEEPVLNNILKHEIPTPSAETTSNFRGVSWANKFQKWVAQLQHDKKHHFIGMFNDQSEAALAYNAKAKELMGPKAKLNDIDGGYIIEQEVSDGNGQRKRKNTSSRFKGVTRASHTTWTVEFRWKGTRYKGGNFSSEIDAAKRYNQLALEITSNETEKPRVNILPSTSDPDSPLDYLCDAPSVKI